MTRRTQARRATLWHRTALSLIHYSKYASKARRHKWVINTAINHIHLYLATYPLDVDMVVFYNQIIAMHQGHIHLTCQKRMLIIGTVKTPRGEYYDLWKETRQWSIELMKHVYAWAGIEFDKWEMPVVNADTFQSAVPNIFFGGDSARTIIAQIVEVRAVNDIIYIFFFGDFR